MLFFFRRRLRFLLRLFFFHADSVRYAAAMLRRRFSPPRTLRFAATTLFTSTAEGTAAAMPL